MRVVNPFWWKAYVPLRFAHLYSVDDFMICISVSHMHLPSFNDKLFLAILSQCQPGCPRVLQGWYASLLNQLENGPLILPTELNVLME